MIKVSDIRLALGAGEDKLKIEAARALGVPPAQLMDLTVLRRAVDARHKNDIRFAYTVAVTVADEAAVLRRAPSSKAESYAQSVYKLPDFGGKKLTARPVVIGAGPAGILAAWVLARAGMAPLVLERGDGMDGRRRAVQAFLEGKGLNGASNVQFGEGGAGTFSDGKLMTRIRDIRCPEVLRLFVRHGAPEDILFSARAHVGTDKLWSVIPSIRGEIERLGGQYRFLTEVTGVIIRENQLAGLKLAGGETVDCQAAVLAVGHSARDTMTALRGQGVAVEAKPFAVGFRVEHPQALVDRASYGRFAGHPLLGAADYHVSAQVNGRPVYSFCMCPGGQVINASSEQGRLAVNGMSLHARDGVNANAAIVAGVQPEDLGGDALAGIAFQRDIEEKAYVLGRDWGAPAQRLEDFLAGRATRSFGAVKPTVRPGAVPADLNGVLPEALTGAIKAAFAQFERALKGFAMGDAVLTAVESRTSSPVRIVRGADLQAEGIAGLYPAGEGAGYAGGILSAAVDGMRAAEALISQWRCDGC